MPFTLIKGAFHVVGYSPDGDSVRFQADNLAHWGALKGAPAKVNAKGHAQLRIEAIDTLETHYENFHQPLRLADQATLFLLNSLQITGVQWNASHSEITQAQDGTRGYILTRATDKYARPIAFVFPGDAPEADGSSVFLDAARLSTSANYQALAQGMAYPTYYQGLFPDLRLAFNTAVANARVSASGIWAEDKTNTGFAVTGIDDLQNTHVIMPKLFRRLSDYIGHGGSVDGFDDFLEANPDPILIVDKAHFTNLDTIVEVNGNQVRLEEPPENLIFIPQ